MPLNVMCASLKIAQPLGGLCLQQAPDQILHPNINGGSAACRLVQVYLTSHCEAAIMQNFDIGSMEMRNCLELKDKVLL